VALVLVVISTVLSLKVAPAELSWDEADYTPTIRSSWSELMKVSNAELHYHGPMLMYLGVIGTMLPESMGSLETRMRLPSALLCGLAIGAIYVGLRRVFATSEEAALLAALLLGLSIIRVQETNIIGPHYPMVLWVALVPILGFHWLGSSSTRSAIGMGLLFGMGAITMSYWLPLGLAWTVGVLAATGFRFWLNRGQIQRTLKWSVIWSGAFLVVIVLLWPRKAIITNFFTYTSMSVHGFPVVVGDRLLQHAGAGAFVYWLSHLDLPFLMGLCFAAAGMAIGVLTNRDARPRIRYLTGIAAVILLTACSAHIAGARNLLMFLVVVAIWIGVGFDLLFRRGRTAGTIVAAGLIAAAIANVYWIRSDTGEIPYLYWGSYKKFVTENPELLNQTEAGIVDGVPILSFYARQASAPIRCKLHEMPWSTDPNKPVPETAKWALVSELCWRFLPKEAPIRRVVVDQWDPVWSSKEAGSRELRLYRRPE